MIQELPPQGPEEAFNVRIPPRNSIRGFHFLKAARAEETADPDAMDPVVVVKHKTRLLSEGHAGGI